MKIVFGYIIGKNYDVNGKQTMWWSQNVIREYVSRAQCFIKEYDQFMLFKNVNVSIHQVVSLGHRYIKILHKTNTISISAC